MEQEEMKVIYYENELEDEFSAAQITPRRIDGKYEYVGGFGRKVSRLFWYRMVAQPIGYLFLKIKFRHKIINRQCIKAAVGAGFFLYGNHTNEIPDALIPTMICHPVGVYVIVHPNNVSMPVLGRITPSLGALPLPDDKDAMKHFGEAIRHHIERNKCITIYPEAHIWPYYTKIRNFRDNSFRYPVQHQVPVFCFTNTYQKRKRGKTPQMVTYVDGPFYPDSSLPAKEQRSKLHEQVLTTMKQRSKNSNVELIRYVKKDSLPGENGD